MTIDTRIYPLIHFSGVHVSVRKHLHTFGKMRFSSSGLRIRKIVRVPTMPAKNPGTLTSNSLNSDDSETRSAVFGLINVTYNRRA